MKRSVSASKSNKSVIIIMPRFPYLVLNSFLALSALLNVLSFSTTPQTLTSLRRSTLRPLHVALVPPSVDEKVSSAPQDSKKTPIVIEGPTAWECNEDAECVVVPACNEDICRTSLDVRMHGKWYDLSGWRKAHPAGEHWIDYYDGRDATEVMDAFHSEKGRQMYKRLPASKETTVQMLEATTAPDTPVQIAFRKLRQELEEQGWWKRDVTHEAKLLGLWGSLVLGAALTAHSIPFVSFICLSLSMTAAGWLGHDYVHGVDAFSDRMRNFAAIAAGLAPTWWSDKHNKHHALTNEQGVDEDVATDPFLYSWVPDPSQDSPLRKVQHLVFWIPFSFMFALWRYDSLTVAIDAVEKKRPGAKNELYGLLIHYAILLTVFPVQVWLPSIFLSGLMSALIVTPTHQSEEMFSDYQPDWVAAQFRSTRNAVMSNPFSEWLWGGMQYQLEHHLFPSMPRNKYPLLKPVLQKFAEENNVPGGYRESGEFEILKMNWNLYKQVAEADAQPGAPLTRGRIGQQAAIIDSTSPAATVSKLL
jgi:acyl-lipid Delta6-acetylenase / acyl-lipid (9-3)-desaturase